eukprot:CAMPEP_0201884250 /NCGR_PEP_ID=MMETSP0902-20130614/16807_1 /ASSEMBLY_ACC=CAM_ASM_000551 /TAXON_ID=420261 /ORGANISM="Thalassiosira antarctica, Strain CCMP982" /LENGTH=254 /DNA_ID=CAMNT_0048413173 /DNA_START=37 /DNA_END=798 /DNA_ORIENTATION=+
MSDRWVNVVAKPQGTSFDPTRTALVVIDMQNDFLDPDGFGAALGNDVSRVSQCSSLVIFGQCLTSTSTSMFTYTSIERPPTVFCCALSGHPYKLTRAIEPCYEVLTAAREAGILVIHTREGHRPDMTDVHEHKNTARGRDGKIITTGPIGEEGKLGRILIRGEIGHDIIERLCPKPGEPIIDKPGKGAFYATDLECILRAKNVQTLLVCGVTSEVCVHTSVREANDRGFHCIVVEDACASYFPKFHDVAMEMIW